MSAVVNTHNQQAIAPLPLLGSLLLLAGLSGCGSGPDVVKFSQAEKNLSHIVLAYGDAHAKFGRGPKNTDELKPFLKEYGNPDDLLVSPRDEQAYVVIWAADPTRGGPTDYQGMWQILAYEQKGAGGKRAVADIRGRPMLVPDADFSKLTFVGGHKPSSN